MCVFSTILLLFLYLSSAVKFRDAPLRLPGSSSGCSLEVEELSSALYARETFRLTENTLQLWESCGYSPVETEDMVMSPRNDDSCRGRYVSRDTQRYFLRKRMAAPIDFSDTDSDPDSPYSLRIRDRDVERCLSALGKIGLKHCGILAALTMGGLAAYCGLSQPCYVYEECPLFQVPLKCLDMNLTDADLIGIVQKEVIGGDPQGEEQM